MLAKEGSGRDLFRKSSPRWSETCCFGLGVSSPGVALPVELRSMIMSSKRILIVDDCPVLVRALTNVLAGAGYEVLAAEDGAAAVSMVRRERPDLLLLDITFPPDVGHGGGVSWDGFLIMSWLGRMEETQHIPIVMISGGDAAQYRDRALRGGAVAYFQKPIEPNELLGTIREIFGETEPQPAPAEQSAPLETV
jgi:CheY-like chemotaxis protein